MNPPAEERVRAVVAQFAIDGELQSIEGFERGHIHDTFISRFAVADGAGGTTTRRYLHQRVNDRVFKDVRALMNNIECVTRHLASHYDRGRGDAAMRALELVPARTGANLLEGADGRWRTFVFIEGTRSHDVCSGPEQAWRAARAFGRFQADLADLDVDALKMTIPSFFSSPYRLRQFDEALAQDARGRAGGARPEIAFVQARRGMVDVIEAAMRIGRFPKRVVHGDTKLNNVLFADATGEAVCVVDLDTCMPGWSLYDFGDLVRFTAARSREDETDLTVAGTDFGRFAALVEGYLESAGSFLTDDEVRLMSFAARLVTFTVGLRFLTDHLNGDAYFKVGRPDHNLDRARVQLAMVTSMEQQQRTMEACVRKVAGGRTVITMPRSHSAAAES